jgi:hypothetical protein
MKKQVNAFRRNNIADSVVEGTLIATAAKNGRH